MVIVMKFEAALTWFPDVKGSSSIIFVKSKVRPPRTIPVCEVVPPTRVVSVVVELNCALRKSSKASCALAILVARLLAPELL